jgi:hypothetical protein
MTSRAGDGNRTCTTSLEGKGMRRNLEAMKEQAKRERAELESYISKKR